MSTSGIQSSRLHSVRALRYTVAASLIVAGLAAATSIHLTHKQAKENLVLIEIGSATSDVISLYAGGLQIGMATRNILLDPTGKAAYVNHDSAVKEFGGTLRSLKQHAQSLFPDEAEIRQLDAIERDFQSDVDVQHKVHDLARHGDFEQGKKVLNSEGTPLWRKYKQTILDFRKWLDNQSTQVSAGIKRDSRLAETASWVSGLILVFASLLAFTTAGRVGNRLQRVAQDLLNGAEQIANAAGQVSSSSRSLAQGASEQAASLEETSASSEEINAMARRNTQNSQAATELVAQSEAKVHETNRALEQTVAAITEINESSDKISKIIKVIDEIAFQTNILALNAAVEAARAGAAGMGFGVVADEVRNLAHRCAEAAKDTASLIESSVDKSRDGRAKVAQVASAIHGITADSARVKALVGEVNAGSLEQSRGIAQIAESIAQMGQVTQTTAAAAEEGASATTELDAQARGLREIVEELTIVIGG